MKMDVGSDNMALSFRLWPGGQPVDAVRASRCCQGDEMIGERVAHRSAGHQGLTFC